MSVGSGVASYRIAHYQFDKPLTEKQVEIFKSMNVDSCLSNQIDDLQEQYKSFGVVSFDEQNRIHFLVKEWVWNYDLDILITPMQEKK